MARLIAQSITFARGFKGEKEVVDRRLKVTHFGLDAKVQFLGEWGECLAGNCNYKLLFHTNSIGGVSSKVLVRLTNLKLWFVGSCEVGFLLIPGALGFFQ